MRNQPRLDAPIAQALFTLVQRDGLCRVADTLGVARVTLARAIAGERVSPLVRAAIHAAVSPPGVA